MSNNSIHDEKNSRWQSYRIDQMGKVNDLIIVLNIAVIGYFVNMLFVENLKLNNLQSCIWVLTLLCAVCSMIFGILLSINRLLDFRKTAKIVREKQNPPSDRSPLTIDEISKLEKETKVLGNKSWCYLYWQIGLFTLSILSSIIFILVKFSDKLFQQLS